MSNDRSDEQARREYWTRCMDEAYEFQRKIVEFPVAECGQTPALLKEAADDAGVEVSFSDSPHADGNERLFYLRQGLIDDFLGVAREMNARGWVLHVEDALRTKAMQRGLARQDYTFDVVLKRVIWELGGRTPDADFMFRRVLAVVALLPKVGTHMSGSALDVSVFRRGGCEELDRGAAYLEMSELTPMDSPFVAPEARRSRKRITEVFERFGFVAYPYEFWHYSKGDAYEAFLKGLPGPARYGAIDFDPATGKLAAIENPNEPLNSVDEIRDLIETDLARIKHSE